MKRVTIIAAMSWLFIMQMHPSALAALSCNPKSGVTTIGLEWVAKQCIPDGVNYGTTIYYENNALQCQGVNVSLFASYGDDQESPASIANYWASAGYRVFINREGSQIVAVDYRYTGLIDGNDMTSYPAGHIYFDVFKSYLYPTNPIPDCQGGDFNPPNTCPVNGPERSAASTANMGTGRLSHDQQLFSTKGSQPLSLNITLYYRSIQFAPSAIGSGWSHSYEMSLVAGTGYNMVFWNNGARRIYSRYSSTGPFVSPKGDWSTLVKNADNTYTITEKDGTVRNFNTIGVITSMVDRNGNTLSFTYTSGKLTSATDANGRSATFTYDGSGKLSIVTDPKGNIYTFNYTSGKLVSVINPDSGQWSYSYAANGLLASKTDPAGNISTYTYDTSNRLTGAVDPNSKSRSYSYPTVTGSTGKIPDPYQVVTLPQKQLTFTEKDGNNWTYTFDTRTEYVTGMTDPLGNTYSFSYDVDKNLLSKTEPGIGTTTYTYDTKGNVLTIKDPLNQTTSYTYNGFSEILTITGAPGNTTNVYDAKGNLTSITDPAGSQTQFGYDARGNMTSITNPRGKVTTFAYDTSNNLITVTDPVNSISRFTYDANGNVLTATDAAGKVTTYVYDAQNRLTSVTDPLNNVTVYAYDKNGNRKTVTDANNNAAAYKYNYQGQLTEIKDALNNVTAFTYGATGCPSCSGVDQLTAITDAKSQQTGRAYDKIGRLTTETDPLNKATSYGYGPLKAPASKTDGNSATTNYTYDALQRITTKTYPGGATEIYTYDSRNNILTATNASISYTNTYDADNRLASVTDSRGDTISYQYDQAGNRTQMTLLPGTADQRVINYTYDDANRPATIAGPAGTFTYGYDAAGRRSSLAYPNGVNASYTYDDAGKLTGLSYGATGSFTYSYDSVGNRLTKNNETYHYDLIYRLAQTVAPYGTENFTYDAVGNRLTGPGAKDTGYLYNAGNQMTQGRKLQYGYDYDGNQTTKTIPAATDKSWTHTWDYENRLVKVEKIKGTEKRTVTFTYDPFGRRIGKQLVTVIDGTTNTYTWSYLYDNDRIAMEIYTDATGVVTKTFYTQGPGIDEHLALERSGQFYYYHADGLGSVVTITNSAHNVIQNYQYDSFGMITPTTSFANNYTYTGREWDKETGLYYYRARYYDPMEGRFINKDPISFAGGDVNLYGYVLNNPLSLIDPIGLLGFGIGLGGSAEGGVRAAGAGATGLIGGGIFSGGSDASLGGFASGGAFAGGPGWGASAPSCPNKDNWALGAFAGGGVNLFATNADNVLDLSGPFKTYSLNIGWGLRILSLQFAVGKNAAGRTIGVFGYGGPLGFPSGGGFGLSVSKYNTNTQTTSGGGNCPCK
jgi:RHS repeat-associated protein